jgi:hypothetical protein
VALPDAALARRAGDSSGPTIQFLLYAALRREQAAAVAAVTTDGEPRRILAFAQSAFEDLNALLLGRPPGIADAARDGEWTLRDLLRHAIAVELRYREQVLYSARRAPQDPVAIPDVLLPCDRLAPPEPEYRDTRDAPIGRVLELLGQTRRMTDEHLVDLTSAELARPTLWGTTEVDVRERMHQIGVHIVEVVIQTEKMLDPARVGPEARRIVRRIAATRGLHERLSDASSLATLDAELSTIARATGAL